MTIAVPLDPAKDPVQNLLRHIQDVHADRFQLADYATVQGGTTFKYPGLGTHTFNLTDTTADGAWRTIEVNTSNAAGGTAHVADVFRVRHEVGALKARRPDLAPGDVLLRVYAADTRVQPEILLRTALLGHTVETVFGWPVATRPAGADLPHDAVTVVHGTIADIAPDVVVTDDGHLTYKGRRVAMVFNPNLLGQLARRDHRDLTELVSSLDPGTTHEGTWMTLLGFDKTAQQDAYVGTAISPIAYVRAVGIEEAITAALDLAATFGGAFIKPDAASGGALAVPVDPSATRASVLADIEPQVAHMTAKYGAGWTETCPLAAYEFVHGTPARIGGGGHRWDLRWAVHARPDEVHVTPLVVRACPSPVGGALTRENAVCNITGRAHSSVALMSPAELLAATDLTEDDLATCAGGLYDGLVNALASARLSVPA